MNAVTSTPNRTPSKTQSSIDKNSSVATDQKSGLRKRLYFSVHVKPQLSDQDYRCAGCDVTLASGVFSQVRYCEYTGKFFCKNCHEKKKFLIPARILQNWDTKYYSICNFADDFLRSIFHDPMFDIGVVNPGLYKQVIEFKTIKILRHQLFFMRDFIMTCRDRDVLLGYVGTRLHLINHVDLYSLSDFVGVTTGALLDEIRTLSEKYITHINGCQLCLAKGSYCEICGDPKAIYPFDIRNTRQCDECHATFHKKCLTDKKQCPKCARRKAKVQELANQKPEKIVK